MGTDSSPSRRRSRGPTVTKATATPSRRRSRGPAMTKATAADVLQILNRHASDVVHRLRLPIHQVQLSMPMDDLEPRIKVSLRKGSKLRVPKTLSFALGERKIRVPVERANDFQDYKLY
jgi:hypothetical protein